MNFKRLTCLCRRFSFTLTSRAFFGPPSIAFDTSARVPSASVLTSHFGWISRPESAGLSGLSGGPVPLNMTQKLELWSCGPAFLTRLPLFCAPCIGQEQIEHAFKEPSRRRHVHRSPSPCRRLLGPRTRRRRRRSVPWRRWRSRRCQCRSRVEKRRQDNTASNTLHNNSCTPSNLIKARAHTD